MQNTSECYVTLLESVLPIVAEAGGLFADGHRNPGTARRKGKIDLVTDTDVAVEKFLIERLAPLVPGAAFLAEESAASSAIPETCWIIDPVDGTTNFSHGWPLTGICVAFHHKGEIGLGVVNLPVLGECYYAARGAGAFRNGDPIRVSDTAGIENALVATGFPYDVEERIDAILPSYRLVQAKAQAVRQTGSSAIDLAWLSCGRIDVYYERRVLPWDVAAGLCILNEAGGTATRYDGSPFDFAKGRILATNSAMHAEFVSLLSPWEDA